MLLIDFFKHKLATKLIWIFILILIKINKPTFFYFNLSNICVYGCFISFYLFIFYYHNPNLPNGPLPDKKGVRYKPSCVNC